MKIPDRIWAGYYTAIEGLPSPIWFEEKPENNGDLAEMTEMIAVTPVSERAEEMRDLLVKLSKASSAINITIRNKDRIRKLLTTIKAEEEVLEHFEIGEGE